MGASRIEDMTIGELSDRVQTTINREEAIYQEIEMRVIKELATKIRGLMDEERNEPMGFKHRFWPHPWGHCVGCRYPADHDIHQDVPSLDWSFLGKANTATVYNA